MKLRCYALHDAPCEIVPGRPDRTWMDEFAQRHPYRCLPLVMSNTTGWEILSPVSFTAMWNGGALKEDISVDADGDSDQAQVDHIVSSHFTRGVLTFHTGYLFRTPPGWDLAVTGPPNHIKDGVQPLCGIVETDWLPFPFTMNWRFTRPGLVTFKKGEPFCFIAPTPHTAVEEFEPIVIPIGADPELTKEYEAWAASRSGFLDGLRAGDPETLKQRWQRHYYKGETVTGSKPAEAEDHVNRRRLRAPRPAEPGE